VSDASTSKTPHDENAESNCKAGREYQHAQLKFANYKDRGKLDAEEAAEAFDGSEGDDLERARKKSAERGGQ
jgi:hypothetical protein